MVDASREHDDAGIAVQRNVGETITQSVGERIERTQRSSGRKLRDHVAMDTGGHGSAEQRVPDTGRRVGEITNDAPPALGIAHDVDRIVREPPSVWSLAERGEAIARAPPQRDMIDDRVAQQCPRAVEIVEDRLEHPHSSDRSVGEGDELVAVDDQRDRVEPPRPRFERDHASVGSQWQVVDDVAGTFGGEQSVVVDLARVEVGQACDRVDERGGTHPPGAGGR